MADQVLSQEEVDALLSAMAEGEIDLEMDKKEEPGVKSYGFTTQSIMLRDQFYALDEIFDKFASSLRNSLSFSYQRSIDVELVSTEMIYFEECLKTFSNPTHFNIFRMEPLIGSALLAIEPSLVLSLIDCMFGGDGKPLNQVREFTLIEQRMMRKFVVEVLKIMQQSWESVAKLELSVTKTETNPDFLHLVAPDDLVIVLIFNISGNRFSGNMYLCISYLMLDPIKEKLSYTYLRDAALENTWNSQLQELVKRSKVQVAGELGNVTGYTVRDLLKLQVGDVIMLDMGPQDPVIVTVEKLPKYQAFPGVVRGNRAVQITSLLDQNGGIKRS